MLPPAALLAADRLATVLMTLVRAVAPIATTGSTPTLHQADAGSLFLRLSRLVIRLIRISNFGVPAPAKREPAAPAPPHPAPAGVAPLRRPATTPSLPRRPGWLLAALPEIAPATAAELRALLADPAVASLLDATPALHRSLRPLLRSLGLAAAPPSPPPDLTPPSTRPEPFTTPNRPARPRSPGTRPSLPSRRKRPS